MLIYFDSNIVIYLIEQPSVLGRAAATRMRSIRVQGDRVVVSDLTRLECRVVPVAMNDNATLNQFDRFFLNTTLHVVPMTATVFDLATSIRAKHRFSTPDSLHLAAAVASGCDVFLTNDQRLAPFPNIRIESI